METGREELSKVIDSAKGVQYAEARFHKRTSSEIRIAGGELEEARTSTIGGIGVRVLANGAWGFSSTSNISENSVREALSNAVVIAKVSARGRKKRIYKLGEAKFAVGRFSVKVNGPLNRHSIEEKVSLVKETEKLARSFSGKIKSAICSFREMNDEKIIVNSDGASCEILDTKPEFRISAVASYSGEVVGASEAIGVTGGWKDLFSRNSPEEMAKKASATALKLLTAKKPKGERATVVLDSGMVGLLSHEAIGHTVEADFVLSGSIASGKIGKKVASELVTLVDNGLSDGAAGMTVVDDEGVAEQKTVLIENGILRSYLHNRETAALYDIESTGNARAFEYTDEPIIRMRNTYIEPRDYHDEEIIKEVRHGYLLKGARNGQADANGEFMFGAQEAYRIERGEIREILRGVTISGNAFDVLKSVDAIGKNFKFDLGSGYCGKWQPAKVDGGGANIRCVVVVGGE
ncbi:MAG: TldD/PmbA family protein [Thaumarchaeota archaeon]|nr:TldD/PmbA family protein [Nitrososphaerota archaeon]